MNDDFDAPARETSGNGQVGYASPPMVRRFKVSGNPDGRPKGAKNRETVVKQVAQEMQPIVEDGRRTRRSTLELVLLRLRNMAMEGSNSRAPVELFKLLEKYEPRMLNPNAGVLVAPAEISPEEWMAMMERKNAIMDEHGFRNLADVAEFERQQRKKAKSDETEET